MNAEIFAEWLRRQDHRVVRTVSSYWFDYGLGVFQAFPYHWVIQPSERELSELFSIHCGIGIRYSTNLKASAGCLSYHAVLDKSPYDLNRLNIKVRYNIRLGLRHCTIQQISLEKLAYQGWRLQADTLDRQGRGKSMTFEHWKRLCLAAQDLPGFEAWGAFIQGQLGSSALICQVEDWCYILYSQSHRDYLPAKINNALAFAITTEMLARPGISSIHYGLHSLDAPPSVDEFKFRMGYTPKPVRQRVLFHPFLRPLMNRATHAALYRLNQSFPGHVTLAKAEGMVRFYLEGLKPLQDQQWPACLEGNKDKILATDE